MNRFPLLLTILLFAYSLTLSAQQDSVIQAEIDQQVWYPFIKAYNNFDGPAYNKIHTADVVRGTPWGIRVGAEYHERNLERFAENKAKGLSRRIAFTFEYRVHRPDIAYEVGYYRVTSTQNSTERTFYGQFHVVLKKTEGVWQIAQDWDSDKINKEPITAANFLKQADTGLYE